MSLKQLVWAWRERTRVKPHASLVVPPQDTPKVAVHALGQADTASDRLHAPDKDDTARLDNRVATTSPGLLLLPGERIVGAAALRDVGRVRRENQDQCFAQWINFPSDATDQALGLFVVADGMGGHADGAEASRLAVTTVVRQVTNELLTPYTEGRAVVSEMVLQSALQSANTVIYEASQAAGSDMGTTCTAVVLIGRTLVVAHVGDSRALLISGGQATSLTIDHSVVSRLQIIGALTAEEGRDHPMRHQLYRCVGQEAEIEVDVITHHLEAESHLVVCSDGLWGVVPAEEIVDIVVEAPSPQSAARQLIARANLLGGHDNIGVVVVAMPQVEVMA